MDDIVERLTEKLASARPQYMVSVQPTDLADVLGEIVRLRAEVLTVLEREAATTARHDAKLDALEAERDRLRKALLDIDIHGFKAGIAWAVEKARAALKGDTQG